MIPDTLEEELSPARSYGLIETVGQSRQEADGDDERELYFEICSSVYGDEFVKVFTPLSDRLDR